MAEVDQNASAEHEAEETVEAELQGGEEPVVAEKKWPGWPGESVFRMLVPAQKVGGIIGRKGEFIKKIVEETRARVKILDGPPGTAQRAVSLFYFTFRHSQYTLTSSIPVMCILLSS